MRTLKFLAVVLLLAMPAMVHADATDVPGSAVWYVHIDFKEMQAGSAGQSLYAWLDDEVFAEIEEEIGIDFGSEVDRLTAFSLADQGPVIVIEGNISQESKDMIIAFVAVSGDLQPLKSSGKSYYHVQDSDEDHDGMSDETSDITIDIESLEDEAWLSLAVANKLIVTSSEGQMQQLLANDGKIAGDRGHGGALIVLTAEKTLLQAGAKSSLLGDDDDGGWESNILRNAEQIAFMLAADNNSLVIEAKLVTTEPDMAQTLASVARGLISLVAFDDDMEPDAKAVLRSTKVEADGRTLSLSLVIAADLLVATLRD